MTKEELEELELLERLYELDATNNLVDFITYVKEDYEVKWFHKEACYWIDKLLKREIKKLMIFLPPQHGKTEISSRMTPAYALGKNPSEKVILMSYNVSKAGDFCVDCNRIIKSEPYSKLFPKTVIAGKDTNVLFEVNYGKGFYKAAGVGSGITGTTGTIGIIDDPFKGRVEATSQTNRDSVWKTYQDDFLTRLNNDSVQLMLFTRWHEDDIAGRILDPKNEHYDEEEASEWTVIAIPALKEATKPIECALDLDDPREIDEALWEEKHSAEKYIRRRRTNPTGFTSLDQQRPSAQEGNKIRKEWWVIKNESELPFNINSVKWDFIIDGAFTEQTKNDETGLGSFYFHKPDGNLYVRNIIGIRKELYELLKFYKQYILSNGYKPQSTHYIELKASGHPLKSMLSKVEYGGLNTRKIPEQFVGYGKFNRVENSEPFIASGRIILIQGPWIKDFIEQCGQFPNGVNDDMVDVITYAIHLWFIKEVAKSRGAQYKN